MGRKAGEMVYVLERIDRDGNQRIDVCASREIAKRLGSLWVGFDKWPHRDEARTDDDRSAHITPRCVLHPTRAQRAPSKAKVSWVRARTGGA